MMLALLLPDILLRIDAKALSLMHYFTGRPCNNGHICQRLTSNQLCVLCAKNSERKWKEKNPVKLKAKKARYYKRHKIHVNAKSALWREKNQEKLLAKSLANRKLRVPVPIDVQRANARLRTLRWSIKNPDKERDSKRRWKMNNHAALAADGAHRRSAFLMATPHWADLAAIRQVYKESARIEKETGIPHHVDHIIPLRGKMVCGLHVPWNLQPIPAIDNIRKGNRITVGE